MPDDTGERVFVVSEDGTTIETPRIGAMMTGRGDRLLKRLPPIAAEEQPDVAPRFIVVQSVERMTGRDAGFASGAFVEVNLKGILLPRGRWRGRQQTPIMRFERGRVVAASGIMPGRKPAHRRQALLLGKQLVNQSPLFGFRVSRHGKRRRLKS